MLWNTLLDKCLSYVFLFFMEWHLYIDWEKKCLNCTCIKDLGYFQCYTVDEESEEKMLKQAAQYHTAQQQNPSKAVPLIALFCGKVLNLHYNSSFTIYILQWISVCFSFVYTSLCVKDVLFLCSLIHLHTSWFHTILMQASEPFRKLLHCRLLWVAVFLRNCAGF